MGKTAKIIAVIIILAMLFSTLAATFVHAQTIEELCSDADLIVPVEVLITGENCHSLPSQQTVQVNLPDAGFYLIKALIDRGNPDQCQTNESVFLEVGGQSGPIALDDVDDCAVSSRLDILGEFELLSGQTDFTFHSGSQCPPDNQPNSVEITQLCLFHESIPTPECSTDIECDDENEYTLDQCINPGTLDSFCRNNPIAPAIEILNPESRTYDQNTLLVEITSNYPDILYSIDGEDAEFYSGEFNQFFEEGSHVIEAFVTGIDGTTVSDLVEFIVDLGEEPECEDCEPECIDCDEPECEDYDCECEDCDDGDDERRDRKGEGNSGLPRRIHTNYVPEIHDPKPPAKLPAYVLQSISDDDSEKLDGIKIEEKGSSKMFTIPFQMILYLFLLAVILLLILIALVRRN